MIESLQSRKIHKKYIVYPEVFIDSEEFVTQSPDLPGLPQSFTDSQQSLTEIRRQSVTNYSYFLEEVIINIPSLEENKIFSGEPKDNSLDSLQHSLTESKDSREFVGQSRDIINRILEEVLENIIEIKLENVPHILLIIVNACNNNNLKLPENELPKFYKVIFDKLLFDIKKNTIQDKNMFNTLFDSSLKILLHKKTEPEVKIHSKNIFNCCELLFKC